MRYLGLGLVLATACSSSNHGGDLTIIDAPAADAAGSDTGSGSGGSGSDVSLTTVYVYGDEIAYVAYRDGSGAWTSLEQTESEEYNIPATGPYEFVVACVGTAGVVVSEQAAVPSDGENEVDCYPDDSSTGFTGTTLTGTMNQPGVVWSELSTVAGSAAPWTFSLDLPPSTTEDLVATGSAAMLIERDLAVAASGSQALPAPIDLAGSGTAYDVESLSVSGTPDGWTTEAIALLYTENGTECLLEGSGFASVALPPSTLVTSNDYLYVEAAAYGATAELYDETDDATQTSFTFLPPLDGIELDGTSASWTQPLPDNDYFELDEDGDSETTTFGVTPMWLAATGATALTIDAQDGSGWNSQWSLSNPSESTFYTVAYSSDEEDAAAVFSYAADAFHARHVQHPRRHRRAHRARR